jgi:hypothetical protein
MAAVQLLYGFLCFCVYQEGWQRPVLSLFAKVSLIFFLQAAESGVLSKLLLTQFDFCGSVFQQFNMT